MIILLMIVLTCQEMLEGEYKKKSKKHARNPDVFGAGAAFRAFKKRKLQFGMDGEAYVEQRDALGDEFYSPTEVNLWFHSYLRVLTRLVLGLRTNC